MSNRNRFLCLFTILIFSIPCAFAQVTGGFNPGQTTPQAPTVQSASSGLSSGSVNLFNGNYQSSIVLGNVATPYGLSYQLRLNYQSTAVDGDNPALLSGIPYGEGWNLELPSLSIDLAAYHKYSLSDRNRNGSCGTGDDKNLAYQDNEYAKEGQLQYFSPTLSIPGIASGRLVYKGIYNHLVHNYRDARINDDALVFVLNEFSSTYVEAIYNQDNDAGSWTVILPNGITYFFNTKIHEVINANNLRVGNEDVNANTNSASLTDFKTQMEPQKVVKKWLISRISNPSVNLNQCIQFDYATFGQFNFHKEYDMDFYTCARDIFLQKVSAGYFTESRNFIAFEKLELNYAEDPTLATGKTDLITSLTPGAEKVDALYYKKTVKAYEPSDIYSDFKHFMAWRSLNQLNNTPVLSTNPYVKFQNNVGTYTLQKTRYNLFSHGFFESPLLSLTDLPSGDLYQVNYQVSGNSKFCNYDLNVIGGNTNYVTPPQTEGIQIDVPQSVFDQNHSNTAYTTFGNIIKYNTTSFRQGSLRTFSGLFTMPNLQLTNTGVFLQIGPGNSDNDYSIPGIDVFDGQKNPYYPFVELRTKSTYFNDHYYLGDTSIKSACSYHHNKTLGIPYNFGGGYPWYIATGIFSQIRDSLHFHNSADGILDIYKDWPNTNTNSLNATLTSTSTSLARVTLDRYAKIPYVLKNVTHYVLNAKTDNTHSQQGQMFVKDGVIEFAYAMQDLDVYPSVITNFNLQTVTPTHVRHAIVLTEAKQKAGDGTQSNTLLLHNIFSYTKFQAPQTNKVIFSQTGITVHAYYGGSENVLLNGVKDNFGKETEIQYVSTPQSYGLEEMVYSYNPEYFGQGGSIKTQLKGYTQQIWAGPQVNIFLSYRVNRVKTKVAGNVMDEVSYNYLNALSHTSIYFPLDNPGMVINDQGRAYTVHKSHDLTLGFEQVMETRYTETTKYFYVNAGGADASHEVFDNDHLFGLLSRVETWKNGVLLSSLANEYKVTKAFESGVTRGTAYAANAEIPYRTNAMQNFDYGDYYSSTSTCMNETYPTDFWNDFSQYNLKDDDILSNVSSYTPANTPFSHYVNIQVSLDKATTIPFLESTKSNAAFINQYHKDYLNSFFIEKTKETLTTYDPRYSPSKGITTTTEYSYYSANYKGITTCKGFGYILDVSIPTSGYQLLYEPSWQLYSQTSYSSQLPGVQNVKENFYYYDLIQVHNVYSTINFEPNLFSGTFAPCAYPYKPTYLLSRIHSITQNGLEALTYAYFWGNRALLFEIRENGMKQAADNTGTITEEPFKKSTYFIAKKTATPEYSLISPFYTVGYYTPIDNSGGGGSGPPPGDGTGGGTKTNTTDPIGTSGDGTSGSGTGITNPPPLGSGDGGINYTDSSLVIAPTVNSNNSGNNTRQFANVNLDGQNLDKPIVIQPIQNDIPSSDPRAYRGEPVQGIFVPLNMVVVQTTDIPNPVFTTLFPAALPSPILHFRQYAQYNPNAFVDPAFEYKPIFPFDTLSVVRNHKFNSFARACLVSNERGLCTSFNTDFPSYKLYMYAQTYAAADERLEMENVGVLKSVETGALVNDRFTYLPNNTLKTKTDIDNVVAEFAYDEAGRLKNVKRNAELLNEYNYSAWNFTSSASSYDDISKLNYVTSRNFIGDGKSVINRAYMDPLGIAYQSVMQTHNGTDYGNAVILSGKQVYDTWLRPIREYKRFVKLFTDGAQHLEADLAGSTSTYYTSLLYDDDYAGSQIKAQADYTLSIGGGHDKRFASDLIYGDDLVSELGLNTATTRDLMPMGHTHDYVFHTSSATDEDGKSQMVYTDALGRKIAQVGFVDALKTQKAVTLFVYNAQGLLQKTINPEGQVTSQAYNKLGWVISTSNPDEGETRFMYDYSGKPVLTQTQKQRLQGEFDRYRYDLYGRLLAKDITAPIAPKVYLNTLSDIESYSWMDNKFIYNTSNMQLIHKQKRMYYDVIPANYTEGLIYHDYIQTYMLYAGNVLHQSKTGKPSATANYTNDHVTSLKVFLYNDLGQLLQEAQQFNPLGVGNSDNKDIFYCIEYEKYGITGNIITKNIRKAVTTGTGCNTVIPVRQYHYVYDDWNRLKEIYFNETNDKANGRKVVEYVFDDATGHVIEKKHFSYEGQISKNLNTNINLHYTYDDRLRLTQISSELFNTQLYFDQSAITFGTGNVTYTDNYNGNMNGVESYIKTSNLSNTIGSKGGFLFSGHLLYGYNYDGLNRLTRADGLDYDNVQAGIGGPIDQAGDEEITYDKVGNILTLNRFWDPDGMALDPARDMHYSYSYATGNNQLQSVLNTTTSASGASISTTKNFTYDVNGNVLSDSKRNIAFSYINGNLPNAVQLQTNISGVNNQIIYHYDAAERRIAKEHSINGTTTTDYYLIDEGGNLLARVDYDAFDEKEWYIHGEAKAVKRVLPAYGTGLYEVPVFYITDQHQNTRVTYSASPAEIAAHRFTLETATDYYAFGKVLRQYKNTGCDEKYGFQGSEIEDETDDFYYTQYRHLDVDIARWWGVDPMAFLRMSWSLYNEMRCNPIFNFDKTGAIDNPIYDTDGNLLGTDDNGLQGTAIVMDKKYFKQGMNHDEAMQKDKGIDGMTPQAMAKLTESFTSLPSRPDWDGYLTLDEANKWYREGKGQPLFTSLAKIDLSGILSLGENHVGEEDNFNLLLNSNSLNDGLVYGSIKLKRYPNHQVRAYADHYDFEIHNPWNPLNWPRNGETLIGRKCAGEGQKFDINIYGSKKLTPILPWIK